MARVLLTWELGGGLGHLMNLRPIAAGLVARGHQVFLAAKDLSRVRRVIDSSQLTLLAAPWFTRGGSVATIVTYADLLLNVGFSDLDSLSAHVAAWRAMFKLVRPNLVICDHSPTVLLAARGYSFRVATVGTGFFCPPDETPLRLLRQVKPEDLPAVREREQRLLDNINHVLRREAGIRSQGRRPIFPIPHSPFPIPKLYSVPPSFTITRKSRISCSHSKSSIIFPGEVIHPLPPGEGRVRVP